MKFNQFDKKMRLYETNYDRIVLPENFVVVRIDGRSFHSLTSDMEKPYSTFFYEKMQEIAREVMQNSGVHINYAYSQSDEISFLISPYCNSYNRKERKWLSIIPSIASWKASKVFNTSKLSVFDARISYVHTEDLIIDYFLWRQSDAFRNCINSYVFWNLVKDGLSKRSAAKELENLSQIQKTDLLFNKFNINISDIPSWQKRGWGLIRSCIVKDGRHKITGEEVKVIRNIIKLQDNLSYGSEYGEFIQSILD